MSEDARPDSNSIASIEKPMDALHAALGPGATADACPFLQMFEASGLPAEAVGMLISKFFQGAEDDESFEFPDGHPGAQE